MKASHATESLEGQSSIGASPEDLPVELDLGPDKLYVLQIHEGHGARSRAELEKLHGGFSRTAKIERRNGPVEYLFRCKAVIPSDVEIEPGMVVLGQGHGVELPPLRTHSSSDDRWLPGFSPDKVGIAPMPNWLISLAMGQPVEEVPGSPLPPVDPSGAEDSTDGQSSPTRPIEHGLPSEPPASALDGGASGPQQENVGSDRDPDKAHDHIHDQSDRIESAASRSNSNSTNIEFEGIRDRHEKRDNRHAAGTGNTPAETEQLQHQAVRDDQLPHYLSDILSCPVEVLPRPLRRLVEEGARAIQCPEDYLCVPMLALLGTAIGTSRVLEVKRGWKEGPRIYAAVVGDPGTKKSPALKLVLGPLHRIQQELTQQHRIALEEFRKQQEAENDQPRNLIRPKLRQVFTTDSTVEALAVLLQRNPRGILSANDELTGWVLSQNQYRGGKGADRQAWLSFWSGENIIINRKTEMDPIVLVDPFVCVVGGLPPDVLGVLDADLGRNDGFLNRILFAFPDRIRGAWTEYEISQDVLDEYLGVIREIWKLAPIGKRIESAPVVVTFTPEGKKSWVHWCNDHSEEVERVDFPAKLYAPWAKFFGYAARLALILQICRCASGEAKSEDVDEVSVAGAIKLINYFKSHAKRVYDRLRSTPEDKRIVSAVTWMRKHGTVTARDAQQSGVAGVNSARDAKQLFTDLEALGLGRSSETERGGMRFELTRRPTPNITP